MFEPNTNYLKESNLILNRMIIDQTFNYHVTTKLRIITVHFPRVNRKRKNIKGKSIEKQHPR